LTEQTRTGLSGLLEVRFLDVGRKHWLISYYAPRRSHSPTRKRFAMLLPPPSTRGYLTAGCGLIRPKPIDGEEVRCVLERRTDYNIAAYDAAALAAGL
jgi:hypothetical protein